MVNIIKKSGYKPVITLFFKKRKALLAFFNLYKWRTYVCVRM